MNRRRLFGSVAAAAAGASLFPSGTVSADPGETGPPPIDPAQLRFRPRTLRHGTAREAGLIDEHVARIVDEAARYMSPGPNRPNPSHPGFVVLAARRGVIVSHEAGGHALRYGSFDEATGTPVELPSADQVPMTTDTLFDMASVSKLFTALVAARLAEDGRLDLASPVVTYLPEFASVDPAKAAITSMDLLRHVSGFPSWINLYKHPDNAARMAAIYATPLKQAPGQVYEYSDLNLITLAVVLERITGSTLDVLVREFITEPLGMSDTGYNPDPDEWHRVAATEYQPAIGRGMVRGEVHDENAWSFGGVAGHAGVFSTAADLAVFGQMILGGGTYRGTRVLSTQWIRRLFTNDNAALGPSAARGLGWQIDQRFFMDALTSPVSIGHTGYTGTCLVVDPLAESVFVLLTNRVHPTRAWGTVSDYRRAPANAFARAHPVRPARGRKSWLAGTTDATTATLTAPLAAPVEAGSVTFSLWYDTEPTDTVALEALVGETWQPVTTTLKADRYRWSGETHAGYAGRDWARGKGTLPVGATAIRWTHRTDASQRGRGVYVDAIEVRDGRRVVFDDDRPGDAALLVGEGFALSSD
ncbi:serine hydrolase [Stackebrandtia soli]|uniref:serine hydrolase n=1 Tax=Stackebrandtia soli TaxID=1892856 RepID=UPI0039E9D233